MDFSPNKQFKTRPKVSKLNIFYWFLRNKVYNNFTIKLTMT